MFDIFICCPAYVKTGGPELLHQLSDYLLIHHPKINTYFYYYDKKELQDYTNDDFKKYKIKLVNEIPDSNNSLIIVPETNVLFLDRFRLAKKVIWWQSVDNFLLKYSLFYRIKSYDNKIKALLSSMYHHDFVYKIKNKGKINRIIESTYINFCQSYYSKVFLEKRGVPKDKIMMLSDYINEEYLNTSYDMTKKEDLVAYFPKKGFEVTKKLISKAPQFKWVPIKNMTTIQVKELLLKSKVYVDFGHFPGKDRVPREAALCGCCIITGTKGASKYYEDVPILDKYKFKNPRLNSKEVIDTIRFFLANYEEAEKDFSEYINIIRSEKILFFREIEKFVELIKSEE